jgi:molybdate/tungstate transport system substrate-binding protein
MGEAGPSVLSRRTFLGSVGVVGIGTLAGFAVAQGEANRSVNLLCAGSLARTFEDYVGPAFETATGQAIHGEYYGSNALMRMVEDRTKHPDVVVSADAALLRDRLYGTVTDWDVEFAANSLGLGYDDATALGRRLAADVSWYEAVADADDGDVAFRSEPVPRGVRSRAAD